jgi:hypothetical protein
LKDLAAAAEAAAAALGPMSEAMGVTHAVVVVSKKKQGVLL